MTNDDLHEFQAAWARHGALLERSLAIDERILREMLLRKVRFALLPYVAARAVEVLIGLAVIYAVMSVVVARIVEARYLLVGGALAVFAVGITALCLYLLVSALKLDHDGPVTTIQRSVERIRLVEYLSAKWALLGGITLWLPALLVPFEAVTGIDALARVDARYLAMNLAIGLVILAAGQMLSKRFVERSDPSPLARRCFEALSPHSLRVAKSHLAELEIFEREDPEDRRA